MEERLGAALIGQADAEGIGDRLGGALRREEALLLAVQPEAERLLLGRECSCLARDKAVCKLKEPAARVPALLVVREDCEHGGGERRAHDGVILAQRILQRDDVPARVVVGEAQEVEVGAGVERVIDELKVPFFDQRIFQLQCLLLCLGVAARRDGRGGQEARGDVLVAVHLDDVLGEVGVVLDVLTVERRHGGQGIPADRDGVLHTRQDIDDRRARHLDPKHAVELLKRGGDGRGLRMLTRAAVDVGRRHGAAAQFFDEVEGARHGFAGRVFVHALFVPVRGVGGLTEGAGGVPDIVARELGALKEHLCRRRLDLTVEPPHDARESDRLFRIADDEHLGVQRKFLFVEGGDLFACRGAAHDDLFTREVGEVKGVHRLTELGQDIVRDIDDGVDRLVPRQEQAAPHPQRGAHDFNVFYIMTDVARAEIGCLDGDVDRVLALRRGGVVPVGLGQGSVQLCRELARDAEDGLTVRQVGSDGDVPHLVVEAEDGLDVRPGGGVLRQEQDAVHAGALKPVVVDTELLAGAEHPVRRRAEELTVLDGDDLALAPEDGRAVERDGDVVARLDVGGAGDNLDVLTVGAAVHMTDVQVLGVLHLLNRDEPPDDHPGDIRRGAAALLDLQPAGEQARLDRIVIDAAQIDEIAQPADRQ